MLAIGPGFRRPTAVLVLVLLCGLSLSSIAMAQGSAGPIARERFDAGVEELRARIEEIARQARGVHGNDYVAEVASRPTGYYIAIIVRALSNDPRSPEVCDAVRRHFLERLTGARGEAELPRASARLMDDIFLGRPPAAESEPSREARDLAAKTSLTIALSGRRCAGWLTDWHAIN